MKRTAEQLKENLQQMLKLLKTLRDEIRVDVHLAGMDAQDRFRSLDKQLEELERDADRATDATRDALGELLRGFKRFAETLKKGAGRDTSST